MRWVGIDEAGYGPNLGPMVMTAVVAEGRGDASRPGLDLWRDLAPAVDRAGGDPSRLWVDDSKAIHRGGKGRRRLDDACLAVLDALERPIPRDPAGLLDALGAGTTEDAELSRWLDAAEGFPLWPRADLIESARNVLAGRPLVPPRSSWRLAGVRAVVLGPAELNHRLRATGSKSGVHFSAFQELLRYVWDLAADAMETSVRGDKHGGRHYYYPQLVGTFPQAWIERGAEGPGRSEYAIVEGGRRLSLTLSPRAEAEDGLVALASIVSKAVREVWMDHFNAFWARRVEGLRPTAGYPVDAARFRAAIGPAALEAGHEPGLWWRDT